MSAAYKAVQWNGHKRTYDLVIVGAVVLYFLAFIGIAKILYPPPNNFSDEVLILRGLGTAAFALLHIILCIGPLARLDARFAPLLYNRRHLGVTMFLLALGHAALSTLYYGAFGIKSPISALFAGYAFTLPVSSMPYEHFGLAALLILFVMAATSHDFWLANLSPRTWKRLHQAVYAAYLLLVAHVSFGVMQSERSPIPAVIMGIGALVIASLHLAAGRREVIRESKAERADAHWIDVASIDEIPDDRAKVICLRGRERIAIFKYDGKVSAVSNVCAHQGGPLGEGKIVGGCITCPWHGYQYLPQNGQSPPPYTEKLPTYQVRLNGRRIMLNPEPMPPGTPIEPAMTPPPPAIPSGASQALEREGAHG